MKPHDNKIYLASKSPRRRELLHQIGVHFELLFLRDSGNRALDVLEDVLPNELPYDYVKRVANAKANAAWDILVHRKLPLRPVLAADTTVVLDGIIYGKPENRQEARDMIGCLSGRTHQVLTSVAVHFHRHHREITHTSEVTFCELSPAQIHQYCETLEPYDKAGGYGIQAHAARFISHISGSYSSIMGLPLFETANLLAEAGIILE